MVLQDTWLFHGTIRENIAYGRLDATEEEILAAAEAAHVDHFVRTLPDGYDTVIDDDATNLSAGEKQLLTIARAFLADPPILILDEATSSVDTRTEVLIQRAMARLMRGRTTFVIAHRLSTIRDADTILVMDRGRIVEQGTHDELLARRGFYYDLYNSQFVEPLRSRGRLTAPDRLALHSEPPRGALVEPLLSAIRALRPHPSWRAGLRSRHAQMSRPGHAAPQPPIHSMSRCARSRSRSTSYPRVVPGWSNWSAFRPRSARPVSAWPRPRRLASSSPSSARAPVPRACGSARAS